MPVFLVNNGISFTVHHVVKHTPDERNSDCSNQPKFLLASQQGICAYYFNNTPYPTNEHQTKADDCQDIPYLVVPACTKTYCNHM